MHAEQYFCVSFGAQYLSVTSYGPNNAVSIKQDVKDRLEDAPLKACVAGGHVSYVRKIANEQDILRDKLKTRELSPPISEAVGSGDHMSGAEETADMTRDEAAIAESQRRADSLFLDDIDCLDMDV